MCVFVLKLVYCNYDKLLTKEKNAQYIKSNVYVVKCFDVLTSSSGGLYLYS